MTALLGGTGPKGTTRDGSGSPALRVGQGEQKYERFNEAILTAPIADASMGHRITMYGPCKLASAFSVSSSWDRPPNQPYSPARTFTPRWR